MASAFSASSSSSSASFASTINGVAIYNLAAGRSAPQFMSAEARRARSRADAAFRSRVELLQDFAFPEAARTLAASADGRFVVATGTYPPRVRVFDTRELSMKFERFMDATPLACCLLADDFSKLAFLQDDRGLEVHAAYGRHHRTRVPRAGRHMAFHQATAELLVAASGPEVFRLSLEEGRFLAPLVTRAPAVNRVAVSRVTALIGLACEGGACELFDPRSHARAARLELPPAGAGAGAAVGAGAALTPLAATCLAFEEGGLGFAVGTSDGRCLLYDLRQARPQLARAHPYGLPLVDVKFHRGGDGVGGGAEGNGNGRLVVSTDARQCRIWHKDAAGAASSGGGDGGALAGKAALSARGAAAAGRLFTVIEAPSAINDVLIASDEPHVGGADSGLLMLAGEQERVMSYYIPALGLAPRWCGFLDSVTEELEDALGGGGGGAGADASASSAAAASGGGGRGAAEAPSLYDDQRFVDREELARLGLTDMIGTSGLLRPFMHGFFMDARLHARVRSVLDPDAVGRVRRERARAAVAAERGSRIALDEGSLPKVNRELAARLRAEAERRAAGMPAREKGSARRAAGEPEVAGASVAPLVDERFSKLFTDAAFAIDPEAEAEVNMRRGISTAAAPAAQRDKKRSRAARADSEDERA